MRLFSLLILLTCATNVYAFAHDKYDVASMAQECAECHAKDAVDLSTYSADAIKSAINKIAAGETEHPYPLDQLSKDQIGALSEALARGF